MNNYSTKSCRELRYKPFRDRNYPGPRSILGALVVLISLLAVSLSVFSEPALQSIAVNAAVDIDTSGDGRAALRSQIAILKRGQHIKFPPFAFTEHGAIDPQWVKGF